MLQVTRCDLLIVIAALMGGTFSFGPIRQSSRLRAKIGQDNPRSRAYCFPGGAVRVFFARALEPRIGKKLCACVIAAEARLATRKFAAEWLEYFGSPIQLSTLITCAWNARSD